MTTSALRVQAVRWPEISAGDDLVQRVLETVDLHDGLVLVITSKVVSKATGRVVKGGRADWVRRESRRVVARRGETVIAQTRSGLVLAAAGVDASNVPPGSVALLPLDADEAARSLRSRIGEQTGRNVGVVITDTAGRAWRVGQTDIAIGCAGLPPMLDLRGSTDVYGQVLEVTLPAVADEISGAAELATGKVTGCPVATVDGLSELVLPPGESGPGAAALVRAADADLFGLGARDAVAAAVLRNDPEALRHFPTLAAEEDVPFEALADPADELEVALRVSRSRKGDDRAWLVQVDVRRDASAAAWLNAGQLVERTRTLAAGYHLFGEPEPQGPLSSPGWCSADATLWRAPLS